VRAGSRNPRPDLVINMRAAKALGVMMPTSILLRADQVIK
jgi:ABC-type uncharacterized transport system substrate-binding protein